jgi:ethanolamine utilization protein EutJ
VIRNGPLPGKGKYFTGVDLGTANIVLSVLNEQMEPVAGEVVPSQVVRDGLVVDFFGAIETVRKLKGRIEDALGEELSDAATGIPPGINPADARGIANVVNSAGLTVTRVVDEPTAAALVLGITHGAVVDVGGGTTGISVIEDGKVVYTADEPTGGVHFTYVIAGNFNISFEEAERKKTDEYSQKELAPLLVPCMEKVSSIIARHIQGFSPEIIYLVGGTCCFPSFAQVVEKFLGIETVIPYNPLLVTPLGIALSCFTKQDEELRL